MFCGAGGLEIGKSDRVGRKSAAVIYSLIGTAKLNGIDPESYPRNPLSRIAKHPINPSKNDYHGNFRFLIRRSSQHRKCLRRLAKMEFGPAAVPVPAVESIHIELAARS